MRIPEEQYHMTEPCNNMYMPNPANVSSPKETTGYIIEATSVSTLPPEAQAPTSKRRYNKLKPLLEFLNNWIVTESPRKNGRIDKKYHYKERNITLRSLLKVKRYETDGILPVRGKKKKESNDQKTGKQNEKLETSTMERTNSENMHMSNLTTSTSTAPKGRRGRKRKMKTVVSLEAETSIGVEQNNETTPIDVPINDEAALIDVAINDKAAPIDVPIIDEAAMIDVPITYVENFSDLGH
ncbi:hypothetical protein ES288_A13G142900v1 [Gossypium darwinii]|uniref:Uncharacterized protein n=1 Tax=Gossypium darwinii TaxID=34276 RepID=A0A5D2E057_GOSDA|nr:hypothetical protein ES288_A13G142900v1 [Gossypium darwinii]